MVVTFKKPPLNEVALGYTFLYRPDLLIPHIGAFWSAIEDVYPTCRHAQPIIDSPEAPMLVELPIPRVWFISEDNTRLVQVQQDRLLFNWRDSTSGATGATSYVRYPVIKAEFDRIDALFLDHVLKRTAVPIQPASYTMTYVNIIRRGEGWTSFGDISDVFPDFVWKGENRFLPSPTLASWRLEFPLPNEYGKLTANVQPAKLAQDNEPILKFELVASSGSLGGKSIEFADWADVAHEWIVQAFKDLTSSKMHDKFWILEEQ